MSPLVKSAYKKNNFLISQPKHMLLVLKRTPKTYVQTDELENIYNLTLKHFVSNILPKPMVVFVAGLCLFDLIIYVPVNNLSVTSGRVFLG